MQSWPVAKLHRPFMGYSKREKHSASMVRTALLSLSLALMAAAPADAGRDDQEAASARAAAEQGQVLPLGRLVAMVQARAPFRDMIYLGGPKFDPRSMRYELKFLDGSRVVVVTVDARSGRVLSTQP
jgi:uncharacterized membrane protein YkoI